VLQCVAAYCQTERVREKDAPKKLFKKWIYHTKVYTAQPQRLPKKKSRFCVSYHIVHPRIHTNIRVQLGFCTQKKAGKKRRGQIEADNFFLQHIFHQSVQNCQQTQPEKKQRPTLATSAVSLLVN